MVLLNGSINLSIELYFALYVWLYLLDCFCFL